MARCDAPAARWRGSPGGLLVEPPLAYPPRSILALSCFLDVIRPRIWWD